MRLPEFTSEDDPNNNKFIFKFGFDPKSDDYKVVKLLVCTREHKMMEVEVIRPFECDNHAIAGGHDGQVYWLCCNDHGDRDILAFDLGDEAFYEISLLDSIGKSRFAQMMLGFFNRNLCVTSYRDHLFGVKFDTWVMNDDQSSWMKHSCFTRNTSPMGFNNEFLIGHINPLSGASDPLVLYDPDTTKFKYFEGCCLDDTTRIVQYVDSLVWITPAKKIW
uniref:F-box/kelch-repeat protein At3g06240-like n=1 Tax=Erigeron canadensis TaxID=72917 RepID=UPI001CB9B705|nr:F-box/kelch-repeat protein At3g06240-like [Erigeron canadensis]